MKMHYFGLVVFSFILFFSVGVWDFSHADDPTDRPRNLHDTYRQVESHLEDLWPHSVITSRRG